MGQIEVQAGKRLLESHIRTPQQGICELVWNAFDEDATLVDISVESNGLGAVERILITDDGNGMNAERAALAFEKFGDSWKAGTGTVSQGGKKRPVHGKYGRGRYSAFALGNMVRWSSVGTAIEGSYLQTIQADGERATLDRFSVEVVPTIKNETGTEVSIVQVPPSVSKLFDTDALLERLLTEFALHLDRYSDFRIRFLGKDVDASSAIEHKEVLEVSPPPGVVHKIELTVIEWHLTNVDRRLYLCANDGRVLEDVPPGIQAPGAEFTAYLNWDGFNDETERQILDGDTGTNAGKVIEASKDALRVYMAERLRDKEAATVLAWKSEGVYPYSNDPSDGFETAKRETFNVIAMAASRSINETKSRNLKRLALNLLKQTLESDPESLLPILMEVSTLPQTRIDELKEILEHTTLSRLIETGHEIGSRVEFISGLNSILFDSQIRKRLLERRQLHRILAHETWIFGEEWSLTGDDERLSEVLKKHLALLGLDAELASQVAAPPSDPEKEVNIPDLVLGRSLETSQDNFAQLVVELKRPSHPLSDDDVSQLRRYAQAIVKDERFRQPNVTWEFWLVGNSVSDAVDGQRREPGRAFGVVQAHPYRIVVKTWAEVISAAEHRLKFVQNSLQFESNRDSGLAFMRDKYAQYLPDEALTTGSSPAAEYSLVSSPRDAASI